MKHIFYLLLPILAICGVSSCDDKSFLDETSTTDLDYEAIFSDSAYTIGFLSEIYREIGFDTNPSRFEDGGLHNACDEAQFKVVPKITTDVQFATGTVNPVAISIDAWEKPYENIRRVNIFLASVDKAPLSANKKTTYKAEARFLRAWYYFLMLRHYGGIPLLGDVVYKDEEEITKNTRDSFADCVDYIVQECETAALDLQVKPMGKDHGRIGAGACKSLMSRVLLYAASPLFNGGDFAPEGYPKELVCYPNYDPKRWEKAMNAAAAVIGLNNGYSLYVDNEEEAGRGFYRLFLAADYVSSGAYSGTILERKETSGSGREKLFQPPSRMGGKSGYAYQELADAFPMKNGKAITDPTSGYKETEPYVGREPRFYNSIIYDQTLVMNKGGAQPVDIYLRADGSSSGQDAVHLGTSTGYYINKMVNRDIAANDIHGGPQSRPLIRYAEILLNYAEARNEFSGPSDEVYEMLKMIRNRAGIDAGTDELYGLKNNMNQAEMREAIRHERRIELAIEGHRFWDVKRWMIAEHTDSKTMTGMEVRLLANGKKTYTRFDVRKRVFRKAMYFWPIPNSEVSKSADMIQNPYY